METAANDPDKKLYPEFNPYLQETTISRAWLQYLQQAVAGSISFDDLLNSLEFDVNTAIQDGKAAIG